jgi:hypothetical protein
MKFFVAIIFTVACFAKINAEEEKKDLYTVLTGDAQTLERAKKSVSFDPNSMQGFERAAADDSAQNQGAWMVPNSMNMNLGAPSPRAGGFASAASYGGSSYGAAPAPAPGYGPCPSKLLFSCQPQVVPVPCLQGQASYQPPSYPKPSYPAPAPAY